MRVLGVDLACSWASQGSALLEFDGGRWTNCRPGAIEWPDEACDPSAVAQAIERFTIEHHVQAVSLDGPQGWRDPTTVRRFVGRQCELETHTPGKTGTYYTTYPRTWRRWVGFCIDVFARLLGGNRAILVNDPAHLVLDAPPPGRYFLLECFPTSTWRSSGLVPLKGHHISRAEVAASANALRRRYQLPVSAMTDHHDNLQAIVAALPAAAFLGGPCRAVPRGEPARQQPAADGVPAHAVEGLIWDATAPILSADVPVEGRDEAFISTSDVIAPSLPIATTAASAAPGSDVLPNLYEDAEDSRNPILPDSRDPVMDDVIRRGIALFERLVALSNTGQSAGVGYACFVQIAYAVPRFSDVAGRSYLPTDAGFVIRLAMEVTQAAGGRKNISKNGVTIPAAMDTFIWGANPPHDRPARAWVSRWSRPRYSRAEWQKLFPDGTRYLLPECKRHR
jgi:hypothetical protein